MDTGRARVVRITIDGRYGRYCYRHTFTVPSGDDREALYQAVYMLDPFGADDVGRGAAGHARM
jgi:hypothetical protein